MAGHNHGALAMDPALVKYNNMSANRWKYFRWTPRTAWISIAYMVAVPAVFGYIGFVTDVSISIAKVESALGHRVSVAEDRAREIDAGKR